MDYFTLFKAANFTTETYKYCKDLRGEGEGNSIFKNCQLL